MALSRHAVRWPVIARGAPAGILLAPVLVMAAIAAAVLAFEQMALGALTLPFGLAFLAILFFFRDPRRVIGAGVVSPADGRVLVAGRVVSLIELGAGFHPELTGRENVYLGGGLFGLTRPDIDRRFDEIVGFAEVERLIDTPMKRYSSGLYARLGFSVAIHSNPDIVLVDEVLAVGDAAFRRRALESLRRMIAGGKTVLFISHDMWNVRRLCERIIWMDEGRMRAIGPSAEIADQYMEQVNLRALANQQNALQSHRGGTGELRYTDVEIVDASGRPTAIVRDGGPLTVRAAYNAGVAVAAPVFQVAIVDVDTGLVVGTAASSPADVPPVAVGAERVRRILEVLDPRIDAHLRPARLVRRRQRRSAVRRHGERPGRSRRRRGRRLRHAAVPVRASRASVVLICVASPDSCPAAARPRMSRRWRR